MSQLTLPLDFALRIALYTRHAPFWERIPRHTCSTALDETGRDLLPSMRWKPVCERDSREHYELVPGVRICSWMSVSQIPDPECEVKSSLTVLTPQQSCQWHWQCVSQKGYRRLRISDTCATWNARPLLRMPGGSPPQAEGRCDITGQRSL